MAFRYKLLELVQKPKFILTVWVLLALFAGIREYIGKGYNNYLLYKYVYHHTVNEDQLFNEYPEIYFDSNHYGPFFSVVIAPFALLPDVIAIPLWVVAGALLLFYSINLLPLNNQQKAIICWLITNELFTSYVNTQFNPVVTATIILAFCFIRKEKEVWAAFFIMFGTFVKLYSITGLAFFFFSNHRLKLLFYCSVWAILFFVLPMAISSPDFIVQSYDDWWNALVSKNSLNADLTTYQDFSVMGIYRRVTGNPEVSSLYFLVPGIILFFIPYLKFTNYKDETFQQFLLCSVLIFMVIFSSSSEGSTYIIAMTGVALWLTLHKRPWAKPILALTIFALLASLSSLILPSSLYKEWIIGYSLKALPFFLVWIYLVYEMVTGKGQIRLPTGPA